MVFALYLFCFVEAKRPLVPLWSRRVSRGRPSRRAGTARASTSPSSSACEQQPPPCPSQSSDQVHKNTRGCLFDCVVLCCIFVIVLVCFAALIGWSRASPSHPNPSDWLTSLIYSCLLIDSVPKSKQRFSLLPVDECASAILLPLQQEQPT
jgi:hypothetical protein